MKKILLIIFLLLFFQSNCFSQEGITFLYINGSNNNDTKMKNWYENGVKKLHPCLKKSFEGNEFTKQYFLKNGEYSIVEKPLIFFWGDRSKTELDFVENDLNMSKGFSPWVAFQVRSAITHFLHDAIWVQKYHNMLPILEDLHKDIKKETQKGNKTVLFGYSAGSFITYEYLLTRLPYINVMDFFNNTNIPQFEKDFVVQHPVKNTCMTALGTDLAVFSVTGHIIPNDDNQTFRKNYMNLNKLTDEVCTPPASIKGIVNFASPLVLFYSDLSDPNFKLTYYNRLLIKYLIENGMFWLTVNYREDPLGFPCGRNLSIEEMENIANMSIAPGSGFIYDQSDTPGHNAVFTAHTSYWATRRNFSKAIVRAYINGYKHQYDDYKKHNFIKNLENKLKILP